MTDDERLAQLARQLGGSYIIGRDTKFVKLTLQEAEGVAARLATETQ